MFTMFVLLVLAFGRKIYTDIVNFFYSVDRPAERIGIAFQRKNKSEVVGR